MIAIALLAATAATPVKALPGIGATPIIASSEIPERAAGSLDFSAGRVTIFGGNLLMDLEGRSLATFAAPISDVAHVKEETLVVAGTELHVLDARGFRATPVKLPANGMRIAIAPAGQVFLYGGDAGSVFRYEAGGLYAAQFSAGGPITALAAAGNRVVFAMGSDIFTWAPREDAVLVTRVPDGEVTSLAIDAVHAVVYGSTDSVVFAVSSGAVIPLFEGLSGELSTVGTRLLLFDRSRRALFGIDGLERVQKKKGAR